MRAAVFALLSVGCTATTSLDGVFGDPPVDASFDGREASVFDASEADGLIFPPEDAAPPCGGKNEACCDGKCNAGLTCTSDKCVEPPPCGADMQMCCGGSACNGATCHTAREVGHVGKVATVCAHDDLQLRGLQAVGPARSNELLRCQYMIEPLPKDTYIPDGFEQDYGS